jgi:hypothetical protein
MADDKVKKGPLGQKAIVDTSILDPKRIEEIRAKAKSKVEKERQAAAEAQLLSQFEAEERQAGGIDEPSVEIYIDLAPYADRIMLDGVIYFQGQTKTVRESVAAVMLEMMSATWKHQSIVDGKAEDFYRKSRGQRVVPLGNGGVGVSNILRA